LRYSGALQSFRDAAYLKELRKQFKGTIKSGISSGLKVQLLALSGVSGSGKTTLLRDLADSLGLSFDTFDCLAHFNIPAVKKLLTETIPDTCNTAAILIELTNFDKYKMLID
jgi:ABC-type phosphate/phosphonate transport system ATPase subunit